MQGVYLPPVRTLLYGIGGQVLEGTVVPGLVFWVVLQTSGLVPALLAGLVWCYGALAVRRAVGARVPAVLAVGTLLLTARTAVALAFQSTFVYLLTPSLSAFLLAGAFAWSVLAGSPLTERFARDFIGLPPHITALARVQTALRRLAWVWALVNLATGVLALGLLVTDHVDAVVMTDSVVGPVLSAGAVGLCMVMGRRALRAEGVHLHLRWRDPVAV